MRLLMRNTVFKTAALAGLFSCMLMLAGAFSGITTSVHAIHADEVDTQAELEQFVKEAIDEYYINTIIQSCDFTQISKLDAVQHLIPDLSTLSADQIRELIPLFSTLGLTRADMEQGCNFSQRFGQVFGYEEGDWKSGSVYLFIMDGNGNMLYHGANQDAEGSVWLAWTRAEGMSGS